MPLTGREKIGATVSLSKSNFSMVELSDHDGNKLTIEPTEEAVTTYYQATTEAIGAIATALSAAATSTDKYIWYFRPVLGGDPKINSDLPVEIKDVNSTFFRDPKTKGRIKIRQLTENDYVRDDDGEIYYRWVFSEEMELQIIKTVAGSGLTTQSSERLQAINQFGVNIDQQKRIEV